MCCISCQNSVSVEGGCCHVDCKTVGAQRREVGGGGVPIVCFFMKTLRNLKPSKYKNTAAVFFFKDKSEAAYLICTPCPRLSQSPSVRDEGEGGHIKSVRQAKNTAVSAENPVLIP